MSIKIKEIDAQFLPSEKKDHKDYFAWVRPDANHGSAMEYTGWSPDGSLTFPKAYSFNKAKDNGYNQTLMGSEICVGKSTINGSYINDVNLTFFKVNIYDFNPSVFKLMKVDIISLRKYSKEQIKHIKQIHKELHSGNPMIVGEYRPIRADPKIDFVFMSDKYVSYFDRSNKVIEYSGLKQPKIVAKKFSKDDVIQALELVGASYADKQIQEKKIEFTKATEAVKTEKNQVKTLGTVLKGLTEKVAILEEAKRLIRDMNPKKAAHLKEITQIYDNDKMAYKQEVMTHIKKYKDNLKLIRHGAPVKEDYSIGEAGIKKELKKIKAFIKEGVIEKMEYDPTNGIKITFPPMEYKSTQLEGRFFLGRPVVIIHDPNQCAKGSSCGTIRFTLPSFRKGYAATDHFNNNNGTNMDSCEQGGQCLGGSGGTSYWTIFGPLIASRRFGELIPKLKQYILEHNRDSPNGSPNPDNQLFELDSTNSAVFRNPNNLLDDSFSIFVDKIKKDKTYNEPEEAYEPEEDEEEEEDEDDGI